MNITWKGLARQRVIMEIRGYIYYYFLSRYVDVCFESGMFNAIYVREIFLI